VQLFVTSPLGWGRRARRNCDGEDRGDLVDRRPAATASGCLWQCIRRCHTALPKYPVCWAGQAPPTFKLPSCASCTHTRQATVGASGALQSRDLRSLATPSSRQRSSGASGSSASRQCASRDGHFRLLRTSHSPKGTAISCLGTAHSCLYSCCRVLDNGGSRARQRGVS